MEKSFIVLNASVERREGGVEKLLLGLFSEHFCINAKILKGVILVSEMISSSVLTFFLVCPHLYCVCISRFDILWYFKRQSHFCGWHFFMVFFGKPKIFS